VSPITETEVWLVVNNGLWILGLSILLAVWSYARYTAHEAHVKTRHKLNEPKATETRWWGRILWILLGISIIVQRVLRIRELQTATDKPDHTTSGEGSTQ